jgi:site-specific DNA recombinase
MLQEFKKQVSDIEKQVGKLIERVVDTDNATIAAAYEKKITQLEREKLVTTEKNTE